MSPLITEIHRRWRQMFTDLAAGDDLPPTLRLRTEGLMEAMVLLDEISPGELQQQMAEIYAEIFPGTLEDDFGGDWQDFFPFPQIPAMARRAPVYPSTSD